MLILRLLPALLGLTLSACGFSSGLPKPSDGSPLVDRAPTGIVQPINAPSLAVHDQPMLAAPTVAAPVPTDLPASGPNLISAERPVRLVITALDVDQGIEAVGLDAQSLPVVPPHNVGWYHFSAGPGQGDNIVLWGHVLRFRNAPDIPAPFARLHELSPGAVIELYGDDGKRYAYRITHQVQVQPDQIEYMLPQGRERLTLISCIGELVINQAGVDMSHRLITIAEPE